jgi:hypothetical protein
VTLDHPTFKTRPSAGEFWDHVIQPLVSFGGARTTVYDWLALVFEFCEGKPFVYYSRYTPSARIYALARLHKVRLRWCPLSRLSGALVARHRFWRQLWLTESQWRELQARLARGVRNGPDPQAILVQGLRHRAIPHPHKP